VLPALAGTEGRKELKTFLTKNIRRKTWKLEGEYSEEISKTFHISSHNDSFYNFYNLQTFLDGSS
jgi:hypothetical protein